MPKVPGLWALAVFGLAAAAASAQPTSQQTSAARVPTVAGWIETISFPEYGLTLNAKLDTGAAFSSLGVTDLERFKRQGKIWYRFTIRGEDGKSVTLEQRTKRVARVTRAEVKDTRRPIVLLKLCLAGHEALTDFTLTNRSSQEYPALVGRKFLASRILVDAGRRHLFPKPCEGGQD